MSATAGGDATGNAPAGSPCQGALSYNAHLARNLNDPSTLSYNLLFVLRTGSGLLLPATGPGLIIYWKSLLRVRGAALTQFARVFLKMPRDLPSLSDATANLPINCSAFLVRTGNAALTPCCRKGFMLPVW